ncbi:hypothetical protein ABZV93_18595 [Actinopolymorpha sp. NPDC004070]|uniref:hypothetical protein n=1 Tax=Actinopolymorpha sp. NPDC004070 TaxID=3154548 RepID=UPI0033BAE9AF
MLATFERTAEGRRRAVIAREKAVRRLRSLKLTRRYGASLLDRQGVVWLVLFDRDDGASRGGSAAG